MHRKPWRMNGIIIYLCRLSIATKVEFTTGGVFLEGTRYLSLEDNFSGLMDHHLSAAGLCSLCYKKCHQIKFNKGSQVFFPYVQPVSRGYKVLYFLPALHRTLLYIAQVKERGNPFWLKLHDRAWRQQAVPQVRSMPLPRAQAVCHSCDAGRRCVLSWSLNEDLMPQPCACSRTTALYRDTLVEKSW